MSCCGFCSRVLLTLFNFVVFLIGLAIFTVTALVKWNDFLKTDLIKNLSQFNQFEQLRISEYFNNGLVILLSVSGFIIFVSLLGFFGACCASKCLLVLYLIIDLVFFLAHLAAFIVFIVKRPVIVNKIKEGIDKTAGKVVDNTTSAMDKTAICIAFESVSTVFGCCGGKGASDFQGHEFVFEDKDTNYTVNALEKCCHNANETTKGCGAKFSELIDSGSFFLLILPNIAISVFLFSILFLTSVLIHSIRNDEKKKKNMNGRYFDRDPYDIELYDKRNPRGF